ncbi:polysaccharide lyase [Paracoccus ravus]|uniref:polysaccharide lyase n=1 Tax=Paracoccus ravus TaxID=2447760 RepID=UPI001ADC5DBC|nr:polysaccharide lyase [Paracoccus ravus]
MITALVLVLAGTTAPQTGQASEPSTLQDGFEAQDFSPEGGLYYRDNFEQSAGEVVFQSEITRAGRGALQLSVRPLCPAGAEGCSERAEIWERTALRIPYDKGVWYGFSMRFAEPVPQDDHRYVMAQWKREIGPEADGDFSPFLALRMRSGVVFATVETNFLALPPDAPPAANGRCPAGWSPVWLRPETRQMRVLVAHAPNWSDRIGPEFDRCTNAVRVTGPRALPEAGPSWHDYGFYTLPGPRGGGMIHIAVDGAIAATIRGHIGHDDHGLGENQYFKFGPYRDAGAGKWTLFYDNFIRAATCEAVLPKARCEGLE